MDFFMKKLFGPIFLLEGCVLSIQQNLRQVCAKSKHEEKKSLKNWSYWSKIEEKNKIPEKILSSLKPVICIDLVKIVAIQNLYRLLCRILYEPWQCQLLGFLLLLNPTLACSNPAWTVALKCILHNCITVHQVEDCQLDFETIVGLMEVSREPQGKHFLINSSNIYPSTEVI